MRNSFGKFIGKTLATFLGIPIGTVCCYTLYDYENASRIWRTIACGIHILYAYKINFNKDNFLQVHENIAKDIYETCIYNDGLYVKFGQGIASMDHLLPPPFFKHLSKLQDKAKQTPIEDIRKQFFEETGKEIQEVFSKFEDKPVASASLAQVHKATLKNGRVVAVKVQKPKIAKQFKADMICHYLINLVLEIFFELPLLHFVEDIQKNLERELDFRIQSSNSKIATANLRKLNRSDVHVPEVVDEFTTKRLLVMEWIDGVKITDIEAIRRLGFNEKSIMNDVVTTFAEQIFISGFVHCDPHPGNVFIRPNPKQPSKHQVVILDFGLCLGLTESFRTTYSQFWKAMFLRDTQKMAEVCKGWGMSDTSQFANMQLMKPYNPNKLLTQKVDRSDVMKMQSKLKENIQKMMNESINFPKQLLFVGRNMNLVRSLNKFHGSVSDRISIMGHSAFIGASMMESSEARKSFWYYWQSFLFSVNIWILQATMWVIELFLKKGLEQSIEEQTNKKIQQEYEQYGFKSPNENTFDA